MSATPFFIVSAGQSGTAMVAKALVTAGTIVEHEYMINHIQPLAVRRYQGFASADDARKILSATHGAAVHHAKGELWGDSSNKLSWLIPDLANLFPKARFIHLVRDGRRVTSSYFHKLAAECYDDRSTEILAAHLADRSIPAPPPEKKYWWPQPKPGEPWAKEFPRFNQFQRIAWHWSEINRVILRDIKDVPERRRLFVRLEDLRSDRSVAAELFIFLGLRLSDEHFSIFSRPQNLNRPVDKMLTEHQSAQFAMLATPTMKRLGYADRAEYAVNY